MTNDLLPDIASKIQSSFDRQGMMAHIGARIDVMMPGQVTLSCPITPEISQQHGFAHAGATFALGDSAAGYAALTLMPAEAEVLTVEMKINLIAPAAGERLIAIGTVAKPGRRLLVTQSRVMAEAANGDRRDVALLQGTMIPA